MLRAFPHARVLVAAVIASLVLALAMPANTALADPGSGRLAKKDRALVATAVANGGTTVTLLVATKDGQGGSVLAALASLGATVRYEDSALGYIRVDVAADRADKVAALVGVEAVEVDEIIPLEPPTFDIEAADTEVTAPGPGTPAQNAYLPTRDIGAPQFVAAHPTYDGRGVKIGILDTGIDLFTPQLQSAKALDGTPVRKIVEWVTYTDPVTDGDPTWVNMSAQVTATGGTFIVGGVTYTAPADGTYRFGVFNERDPRLDGELKNDVNRDGNPAGSSGLFGVLWDTASNTVWVDTDQDHRFNNQSGMTDYHTNYDIGTFGTDRTGTPERDTVPFVVQTDGKNKFVNIGIVSGAHGTHVAGIAAGKGFFDGAYNGAAPEAQIVSIRVCLFISGCTAHALIEGMIFAEKQAGVDVINMSIGGLPALNDGNNTRALIYNRLIDRSGAQMFISAGNSGPGVNTVGDPSVATSVMSIGAYVHKDTWLNNYGATAAKTDGLFVFSSRGPREDGGFKPNIVAPGSAVSSIPAWQAPAGQCIPYACPVGYAMFNGTSMAAPQSTGGAALLVSAARQAGAQYKPDQLRQAINSSARYLPAYGAHEQGNGLFQVEAAWDLLKTNIKTVTLTSSAPVKTVLSSFLATPNYGPGIYEREGWVAGQTGARTITLTRTTGGSKPITYNLTWVGSDGTFTSATSISLAANTPITLTVNVAPASAGVHSALLYVDDPATAGVDYQIMNTVIAAGQFSVANNFQVTYTGSADRPDKATFFFNVPANTPAFKVDLTGVSGRVRLQRFHPYGVPIDALTAGFQTGGTQSRTLSNPAAGVWEVTVDTSRVSTVTPATFTLTASILGVDVSPSLWTIDPATVGTPYSRSFSFTNRFGAFTGNAVGTALGSAFAARPTITAAGPQQVYTITVPAGSTSISARIGKASDASADLDLFLYDCHTGPCVLKSSSTSGSAEEFVTSANPAPGTWKVFVDPYAVPAGSTFYDYVDVVTNPTFGSVTVADLSAPHAYNSTWSASASVTANAAPANGRFLQGFVRAMSGSTVLGSAEVDLKNVSP